jgi:hypothetical protein
MRYRALILVGVVMVCAWPAVLPAQEVTERLRVYLDCQTHGCDFDHFRREIAFADWVRDREDAQVHVLITSERTGGGGRAFTMAFIGLGGFSERDDSLTYTSQETDTDPEVRDGLTQSLALGLVPYAARSGSRRQIGVQYTAADTAAELPALVVDDPWDYWVFRVRAGGFLQGESQQRFTNLDGGVSASRVTEALKLEFGGHGFYGRDEFETEDTTYISTQTSWESSALGVWSLGDHWSAGGQLEVGGTTYRNQDLYVQGGPALEYNVFPYSQSTRRRLTMQVVVGGVYYNYADTTIFDRLEEGHPAHYIEIDFDQNQPWGQLGASIEWLQFWHDWAFHSVEVDGRVEVRLFRGLSIDMFGRFARVKDQLYLPKEDLTDEEILLRRRQLGTDYRFFLNFGFSYRFGSAFNNVVNPRLR